MSQDLLKPPNHAQLPMFDGIVVVQLKLQSVGVTVTGNSGCIGKEVGFNVEEYDRALGNDAVETNISNKSICYKANQKEIPA